MLSKVSLGCSQLHWFVWIISADSTLHSHSGLTCTTVGEEKQHNPRLTKPKEEFISLMAGLGLPYPKKIDESLPANMVCGLQDLPECAQSVLGVALIMITSPIPLIVSHF